MVSIDLSYLFYGLGALIVSTIYLSVRKANQEEVRLLQNIKESDAKYRAEIDAQIQDVSDDVKVISIPIRGKGVQSECQAVVAKMFSSGYRLTAVVTIVGSRTVDHSAGDYSMTETKSILHYFEKSYTNVST